MSETKNKTKTFKENIVHPLQAKAENKYINVRIPKSALNLKKGAKLSCVKINGVLNIFQGNVHPLVIPSVLLSEELFEPQA